MEFDPEERAQLGLESQQRYRIQPGDILRIAFLYLKDLNQDSVLVLPDGTASLVGIDQASLAGLTVLEADSLLTKAYAKEYRNPNLSVIVLETKGKRVYVTGEVNKPGLYELPRGGLGLMNAIALSGGFTEHAAKSGVVLVRVSAEGYLCQEVDLDEPHSIDSHLLATISLEGYDLIYVPRSRIGDFSYFTRNVLTGLTNIMRIATDVKYIQTGARY